MRRSTLAIWTISCFLLIATIGAAAEPTKPPAADDVAYVKGFILRGMLKQLIGSFSTFGHPKVGDTFEIDLANLPKDRINFSRAASDTAANSGPRPAYVPFSVPLTIEQVEKRIPAHGSSLIRLSSMDASRKFVIQVRVSELVNGATARVFLYEETYGTIQCLAEAVGVLTERPVAAAGPPAADEFVLEHPKKDHLTARQLYEETNTAIAIKKVMGQLVLLDVVVKIERNVPLVDIEIPKELAAGANPPHHAIQAHLITATTQAASLKKGERYRIEGVVADEGFGAYTIYLCKVQRVK
jgi:hypothetical protein